VVLCSIFHRSAVSPAFRQLSRFYTSAFLCDDPLVVVFFLFFFNDTAPTEIYTLSLHDALPILFLPHPCRHRYTLSPCRILSPVSDRKSTRLNSSHVSISYAVFCLKKKMCCAVRAV